MYSFISFWPLIQIKQVINTLTKLTKAAICSKLYYQSLRFEPYFQMKTHHFQP